MENLPLTVVPDNSSLEDINGVMQQKARGTTLAHLASPASLLGSQRMPPLIRPAPTKSLPCDDESIWNVGPTNNAVRSNDTDNYVCGSANFQSVKFAMAGGASDAQITVAAPGAPWNITGLYPYVRFKLHAGTSGGTDDWEGLHNIKFRIYNTNAANFMSYTIWDYTSGYPHAGWYEFHRLQRGGAEGGAFDPTDVQQLSMILTSKGPPWDKTIAMTIDQTAFFPQMTRKIYIPTFDDGLTSHYNAAAYLASKGMRGVFYVIPSLVGDAGYLSIEDLREMQDFGGHLIANHSWSHKYGAAWRALTDTEKVDEITKATDWLCDKGFGKGSRVYAAPGGTWEEEDTNLLLGGYLDHVRLTADPAGAYSEGTIINPTIGWPRYSVGAAAHFTHIETGITNVKADGGIVCCLLHDIVGSPAMADFKTHINTLATDYEAGNIEVGTWLDLFAGTY